MWVYGIGIFENKWKLKSGTVINIKDNGPTMSTTESLNDIVMFEIDYWCFNYNI